MKSHKPAPVATITQTDSCLLQVGIIRICREDEVIYALPVNVYNEVFICKTANNALLIKVNFNVDVPFNNLLIVAAKEMCLIYSLRDDD